MPPLKDNGIRFFMFYFISGHKDVNRIGGVEPISGSFHRKTAIAVITLLFFKEKLGILHFVRYHDNVVIFLQSFA